MGRHIMIMCYWSGDTLVWQLLIDPKIKVQNQMAGSHTSYKDCIIAFCGKDRRADTHSDHKSTKIYWMDDKQIVLS